MLGKRFFSWIISMLFVYLGYRVIVQLTDHARAHYPAGWWQYAHMIALTVAIPFITYQHELERRLGVKRWLTFSLVAAMIGAWIAYPLLKWGV